MLGIRGGFSGRGRRVHQRIPAVAGYSTPDGGKDRLIMGKLDNAQLRSLSRAQPRGFAGFPRRKNLPNSRSAAYGVMTPLPGGSPGARKTEVARAEPTGCSRCGGARAPRDVAFRFLVTLLRPVGTRKMRHPGRREFPFLLGARFVPPSNIGTPIRRHCGSHLPASRYKSKRAEPSGEAEPGLRRRPDSRRSARRAADLRATNTERGAEASVREHTHQAFGRQRKRRRRKQPAGSAAGKNGESRRPRRVDLHCLDGWSCSRFFRT
jgi:hypothetical protein